jgi:predicted NBD/HSP70 family sugar kinase
MPHLSGDQGLLKHINRQALVALVKATPGLCRTELAERSGLTKVTVGLLIQGLIEEGWLREEAPSVGRNVGRRPVPVSLDPTRLALIGADLGVDYLAVVGCDLLGKVLHARRIPFRHGEVGRSIHALSALALQVRRTLEEDGRRSLGLGVGLPGMLDGENQVLRFAPNLDWQEVPFQALLAEHLEGVGWGGLPVSILNDARAAALAEYVFGEAPQGRPLVYLMMGVGLGAGIVVSDQLYTGNGGLAGEVGHAILDRGGPRCACGRSGCAEAFVSQRAVSRGATGRDQPILPIGALVERIAAGDRATLRAARQAGDHLGTLLQNLVNTLDPAVFILGGPLCQLGDAFLGPAMARLRASGGRHDVHCPAVRRCRFGLGAVAAGAAASMFQRVLRSRPGWPAGRSAPAAGSARPDGVARRWPPRPWHEEPDR